MNTLFQKMRNNRVKLEKSRDITDTDPVKFYADQDGRMDALNTFIAAGKRLDDKDGFIHGGRELTIVRPVEGGDIQRFTYSGREYNRALVADRAMKGNNPIVYAPTSPEPPHRTIWYKPSTWF